MDPQECWMNLAQAVADEDWDRAGELAEDLVGWVSRGGFVPSVTGYAIGLPVHCSTGCLDRFRGRSSEYCISDPSMRISGSPPHPPLALRACCQPCPV